MEQNTEKFRLRLNLFDAIVIVLALGVGAFLFWRANRPAVPAEETPTANATVRYTVRMTRCTPGSSELIHEGDTMIDHIKNLDVGRVVSYEVRPTEVAALDWANCRYVLADVEGMEDILLTIEAPCIANEESIMVNGEYRVRIGLTAYLRGAGYVGSGPIVAIEEVKG